MTSRTSIFSSPDHLREDFHYSKLLPTRLRFVLSSNVHSFNLKCPSHAQSINHVELNYVPDHRYLMLPSLGYAQY